jgi:hypothetical protein
LTAIRALPEGQDDDSAIGFGLAGGVLVEYADAVRGKIIGGGVHGDVGIGLAARAGARREDGGSYTYAILSIEVRLPFAGGVLIPVPDQRLAPWR